MPKARGSTSAAGTADSDSTAAATKSNLPTEAPTADAENNWAQETKPQKGGGEAAASAGSGEWKKGDRVLCCQGGATLYYDAKIVDILEENDGKLFLIHYNGWHKRFDEKIPESEVDERLKPWTEEEHDKAKEAIKEAKSQAGKKSKSLGRKSLDAAGNKQGSSRGSTPSVLSTSTASAKRARLSQAAQQTVQQKLQKMAVSKESKKVTLPETLRKILVDDNHFINSVNYVPKVPAEVTVDQIVQRYIQSLRNSSAGDGGGDVPFKFLYSSEPNEVIMPTQETCEQSALGLLDYFNTTLGSMLLYKFERPLYADLLAQESAKLEGGSGNGEQNGDGMASVGGGKGPSDNKVRLSSQFGLVHLLRLFVRLGEMLAYTQWSIRALDTIMRHAQDFVGFLERERDQLYNIDTYYQVATPDYQKRAFGAGPQ